MLAGIVPVVIIFVSLAAGHTRLRGGDLGTGLAWLYVVPMVLLAAWSALRIGTRLLPPASVAAFPVAVLLCPLLLQISEALAPLTLAVGVAMLAWVLRAPHAPGPPEVVARPTSGAGTAPGPPTGAPPVRLRLLTPVMLGLTLGSALCSLVLAAFVGALAWSDEIVREGGAAARWTAVVISALATVFGLFLLAAAARARRDHLDIDALGIRRQGGVVQWALAWPDVRAVAVGLHTKVVPDGLTPTPRRLRERRTVQLLLAPSVPDVGGRPDLAPLRAGGLPEPFTHVQSLPDTTPWASRATLADALTAALEAQVPDRCLVLQDDPTPEEEAV
jgi:hypothetical protein